MKLKAKSGSSLDALIACARKEAVAMGLTHVGTEHLLIALAEETSPTAGLLNGLGATADACRQEASKILGDNGSGAGSQTDPQLTPRAKHVLGLSSALAQKTTGNLPSSVHLLLAILEFRQGVAFNVLVSLGVDVDLAAAQLRETAGRQCEGRHTRHRNLASLRTAG